MAYSAVDLSDAHYRTVLTLIRQESYCTGICLVLQTGASDPNSDSQRLNCTSCREGRNFEVTSGRMITLNLYTDMHFFISTLLTGSLGSFNCSLRKLAGMV